MSLQSSSWEWMHSFQRKKGLNSESKSSFLSVNALEQWTDCFWSVLELEQNCWCIAVFPKQIKHISIKGRWRKDGKHFKSIYSKTNWLTAPKTSRLSNLHSSKCNHEDWGYLKSTWSPRAIDWQRVTRIDCSEYVLNTHKRKLLSGITTITPNTSYKQNL